MYYKGERWGLSFWPYDVGMDENTWTLMVGFGGRASQRPGYLDPPYRFCISVEWRPLATCFEWWAEYLGAETQWFHRKGVAYRVPRSMVRQYRIHSFRRWPVAVRFFSAAKNVYASHKLVDGDQFWRCDHGLTGFADGFKWVGCWRCAVRSPAAALQMRVRTWLSK